MTEVLESILRRASRAHPIAAADGARTLLCEFRLVDNCRRKT